MSNIFKFIMMSCALFFTSCGKAQEPMVETRVDLRALPTNAELATWIARLRKTYPEEYRRSENKNVLKAKLSQSSLARKLFRTAQETSPDHASYFALLSESIRLATMADKPKSALEAIEHLSRTHAIDKSRKQLDLFQHFSSKSIRISIVGESGGFVLPAVQEASDAQQLNTAMEIVEVGENIADRILDKNLQRKLAEAKELLTSLKRQEAAANTATRTLKVTPNDPTANLNVAKFLGLRRGEWESAEIFAARVDDKEIRSLFVRELTAAKDTESILQLANDWWKFGETESGAVKLQAKELAATRYAAIVSELKGFERKQVETRLESVVRHHVVAVRIPIVNTPKTSDLPENLHKGLIAYYPFDGNAKDVSRHKNDGTVHGAKLARDRHGSSNCAYQFDGMDDYISAPHQEYLNFTLQTYTVSLWAKVLNTGPAIHFIGKDDLPSRIKWILIYTRHVAGTDFSFHTMNSKEGPHFSARHTLKLPQPQWHQYLVTRGATETSVYIDGALVSRSAGRSASQVNNRAPLTIGQAEKGGWLKGLIDDVRIYDRELIPGEITALYEFERQKK
ncbi:MAG: hypothetical protein CMJ78_05880 [Planctomycetaceae bacterium]|nr:hypothetical protein [Planctomycetaceae bacterium]